MSLHTAKVTIIIHAKSIRQQYSKNHIKALTKLAFSRANLKYLSTNCLEDLSTRILPGLNLAKSVPLLIQKCQRNSSWEYMRNWSKSCQL